MCASVCVYVCVCGVCMQGESQILCVVFPKVFVRSLLIEHIQLHSRLFSFLSQRGRAEITREPVYLGGRVRQRGK